MSFSVTWHTLVEECEELPADATLVAPLSHRGYRVTDVQDQRVVVERADGEETRPLQRDQFEALCRRIDEGGGAFELDNLPPGAGPYASVLSLHPRYEVDETDGVVRERDGPTSTQVAVEGGPGDGEATAGEAAAGAEDGVERSEPDRDVYADALLLVDALERYPVDDLERVETPDLVNLYTLLSDVQRDADDLRKAVADLLLDRVHHDQPVHGQFGSVQRTSRRRRSLGDADAVLATLEDAGIDREQVTSLDPGKVDDALDVTDVSESDVFEVEETEYVRKAEVDEDVKETRLQGLKDRVAASDDPEADALREEIEQLESRIEELTEFRSGRQYHTSSGAE